jgi:hypothetical protein
MDLSHIAQLVDITKLDQVPDTNPVKGIFHNMVMQIMTLNEVNPTELIPQMITHLQSAMQEANVQPHHVEEVIHIVAGPNGSAQLMAMAQAFAADEDLEEDDPMAARRQAILRMEQERRQ